MQNEYTDSSTGLLSENFIKESIALAPKSIWKRSLTPDHIIEKHKENIIALAPKARKKRSLSVFSLIR